MLRLFLSIAIGSVWLGCQGATQSPPKSSAPVPPKTQGTTKTQRTVYKNAFSKLREFKLKFGFGAASRDTSSEDVAALNAFADEVNNAFDYIWGAVEVLADGEPTGDEQTRLEFRGHDPRDPSLALALVLVPNEHGFEFSLFGGDEDGFALVGTPYASGTVELKNDEASKLSLEANFDIDPKEGTDDLSGKIQIDAAGANTRIKFENFREHAGDEPRNSVGTWTTSGDGVTFEWLYIRGDATAHVQAEWKASGGRLDYQADYNLADLGDVEEIGTGCWDATGHELFDGTALFDDREFAAAIVGEESACGFLAPKTAGAAGGTFDRLPEDGEWDELVANSCEVGNEGCPRPSSQLFSEIF